MRECKHNCEVCEYITDCIEEQENQYYQMISWQYDEMEV